MKTFQIFYYQGHNKKVIETLYDYDNALDLLMHLNQISKTIYILERVK